jgi:hypothetical protein
MDFPVPPSVKTPPTPAQAPTPLVTDPVEHTRSGLLTDYEWDFILTDCLKPKHRKEPHIISFIESFVRCKNISQAAAEAGVHYSLGYSIRHRSDVSHCIQKIIDKSVMKYGFDATEIMERTKELVDFDPIMIYNPDGSFKDNMHDIEPAARRNIKKLKVHNLYNQVEDRNGVKSKIIIGKVIEYEFYDKLKAIDMVGKEKEMFKTTTRVEHAVTKDMASILLASAERGRQTTITHNTPKTVEATYTNVESSDD